MPSRAPLNCALPRFACWIPRDGQLRNRSIPPGLFGFRGSAGSITPIARVEPASPMPVSAVAVEAIDALTRSVSLPGTNAYAALPCVRIAVVDGAPRLELQAAASSNPRIALESVVKPWLTEAAVV